MKHCETILSRPTGNIAVNKVNLYCILDVILKLRQHCKLKHYSAVLHAVSNSSPVNRWIYLYHSVLLLSQGWKTQPPFLSRYIELAACVTLFAHIHPHKSNCILTTSISITEAASNWFIFTGWLDSN